MQVLVTGGAGYTGSRLIEQLAQRGDRVRVLALPGTEAQVPRLSDVNVVSGSVLDPNALKPAVEGVDIVYHLAGVLPGGTPGDIRAVNVDGTRNMLLAGRAAHVRRVVFTSSVAVYAADLHPPSKPIDEDYPLRTRNVGPVPNYANSKIAAEQLFRTFQQSGGPPYVILRPPTVYGPYAKALSRAVRFGIRHPLWLFSPIARMPTMQWIHVRDLTHALVLAGTQTHVDNEIFNAAGGECFGMAELIVRLWSASGGQTGNVPLQALPPAAARAAGTLRYDLGRARRVLGYTPKVTLQEGLDEAVHTAGWASIV